MAFGYIPKKQLRYGLLWGCVAFITGWGVTFLVVPKGVLGNSTEHWQASAWFYLSAHFIKVSGLAAIGFEAAFKEIDLLESYRGLRYLRGVPFYVLTVASALLQSSMGWTTRSNHIIRNSVYLAGGYSLVLLAVFTVSSARPGASFVIMMLGLVGGGLIVGVAIVRAVNTAIPVFTFATLGGITLAGIAVLLSGAAILQAILPGLVVAFTGAQIGGGLVWGARNLP